MRSHLTRLSCVLCAAALLASLTPATSAHGVSRLENGRFWNRERFVTGSWYAVEGVLQSSWDGTVDRSFDLEGKFVIPPLGDAHTHHFADGSDGKASAELFLRSGVFYAKNPNSIPELVHKAAGATGQAEGVEVTHSYGGLTASGGHPIQIYERMAEQTPGWADRDLDGEAYFVIDDEKDLQRQWPRILKNEPDFIKTYLEYSEEYAERKDNPEYYGKRGLDPGLLPKIVERAHAAGLTVATHVNTAADFRNAVRAGVDELAHLPLERISPADAKLAARKNVTVVTTTISHRPTNHVDNLSAVHTHNLRLLHNAGVRLVLGTDSGATVVDEILSLSRLGVFTPAELLDMATRTTPQWIFPERKLGAFADGYDASFLVLEANPLEDLQQLAHIAFRGKRGHPIDLAANDEKPGIANTIAPALMHGDLEGAIAKYHELRKTQSDAYDFSEGQLNDLGYALLNHDQLDGAIRIFQLNVEQFPDSSNPYDSLGEAYLRRGDHELAAESYRRSLELNSNNDNAREQLHELGKMHAHQR